MQWYVMTLKLKFDLQRHSSRQRPLIKMMCCDLVLFSSNVWMYVQISESKEFKASGELLTYT